MKLDSQKKELLSSLILIGFALTILLGGMFAMRDFNTRQQSVTGRFIFDNGCYGIYNAGQLTCIASNIGKQCFSGCYATQSYNSPACECLPD